MAKTKDYLQSKEKELAAYKGSYNSTVSVIKRSVESLGKIIDGISATIDDIDRYQSGLADTRQNLVSEKERSEKVLQNFKTLLCID